MKVIVFFAVVVAVALAAGGDERDAQVVRNDLDNIGVGKYEFAYETSNGISAQESGQLVNEGKENEGIAVQGSYEYTDKDGKKISVRYTADENGFNAEGDHIPKAP